MSLQGGSAVTPVSVDGLRPGLPVWLRYKVTQSPEVSRPIFFPALPDTATRQAAPLGRTEKQSGAAKY